MWNIKMVDIGGDGLCTVFMASYDTLAEVEILCVNAINQKLGIQGTRLEHTEDLVYSVLVNGIEIGVVHIQDVNPAPLKRK